MSDRLRMGKPPPYATSYPGRLSLLPKTGREMSTSQSAVMLCGWGVMAGAHYPYSQAAFTGREHGRHFWPPVNTASVCTCDTLVTTTARVHGSDVNKDLTCKANANCQGNNIGTYPFYMGLFQYCDVGWLIKCFSLIFCLVLLY